MRAILGLLVLASLAFGCVDGGALDYAFCDPGEACFTEPPGTGVWCGGAECPANPCFVDWYCFDGKECRAKGYSADFNDGNKCTTEECGADGWIHTPITPEELDDGDPCTVDECSPTFGPDHVNTCS